MKRFFLLILLLLSFASANGQSYYFKHYQTDEGLSDNVVFCGAQDKHGFIWIGTNRGLNRYDGNNFKMFLKNPAKPGSLGNNCINNLFYSSDDILWVGTIQGLYQYNDKTESFSCLKSNLSWNISAIDQDKNRNLWFIANFKLVSFSGKSRNITFYPEVNNDVSTICITPSGDVWVATFQGKLFRYDQERKRFILQVQYSQTKTTPENNIVRIKPIGNNSLLIGTRNAGAEIYDVDRHQFQSLNLNENSLLIKDLLFNNNEIWIATENGVYVYNLTSKNTVHLTKELNNPYSLTDNFVSFLMKDRENTVWAGSYFGGLNAYSYKNSLFNKFYGGNESKSLHGNIINYIRQDKFNKIWISTADAGLNIFNPKTNQFSKVQFSNTQEILPSNIPSLLLDDNLLWIGSYNYGLYLMDIRTDKVIEHYQIKNHPNGLKSNFIYSLFKSRDNKIYVGTIEGLYSYNRSSHTFAPIFHEIVKSITEDRQGNIWIGTLDSGAVKIDITTKRFSTYKYSETDKNSMSSNDVNTVVQDSEGRMWFGTSNGLCRLSDHGKKIDRYDLPCTEILSILEDRRRLLWISSKTGLMRLDPQNKIRLQIFTKNNGLPSNQFNAASALNDHMGIMYFGTTKGLISFDPLKFELSKSLPPVTITTFKVNNAELLIDSKNSPLPQSIVNTKTIKLKHDQSSFSFDFAALSFIAPKNINYAYRMTGVYDNWVNLESNRTVYFTDLKPGHYVFEVKTTNNSGVGNSKPTSIAINIFPPWWSSNTAYVIYFLLIALLVYLSIRRYHLRTQEKMNLALVRLENEKEKEIYKAKIEFFTHITHEIRTPLTLIKGPLENVVSVTDSASTSYIDLMLMKKNTKRLLDLTTQLLDFRKIESKNLNLIFTKTNLNDFLCEVHSEFNPAIKARSLQVEVDMPKIPLYAEVDPEALHKIISNLFTNAIKYAATYLVLKLYGNGEKFVLEAKNDGHKIPPNLNENIFEPFFRLSNDKIQQGSGIGLALCRSLAELHHGTLILSEEQSYSNIFILELPVYQKNAIVLDDEQEVFLSQSIEIQEDQGKQVVLVVEDNLEIAEFIRRTLLNSYVVETATNGVEALSLVKTKNVNLILSDVMMPGMNGFELCHIVKNDVELSHIPFILLTAKNTIEAKVEGLQSGADVYIEKPFSPEHIVAQIKSLLLNRETIKMHFANSPLFHIKNIAYSKPDEDLVLKLNDIIHENIDDPGLDVYFLADRVNMSRTTLYRKIKAISNLSLNDLITLARLKKAAELLAQDEYKIYEVASMVGFNSPTHFGQSFLKQFNLTPKDYAQMKRKEKMGLS